MIDPQTGMEAIAGASAVLLAGVTGLSLSRRRNPIRNKDVHGSARFMTPKEIEESPLFPRKGQRRGVYVGGWTDKRGLVRYLRHDGPEHCIVIGPTRSGKGVGNILPTLLSWDESAIIYDEKGELWALTAGWRAQHAGIAIRWEPAAIEGTARFNFLEEIRLGTPHEVSDAQNIAQMICDPTGTGIEGKDHWGRTSFDLLSAVILHVMYRAKSIGKTASFADVAFALSDPNGKSDTLWEAMRANTWLNGQSHRVIAAAGRDQLDRHEEERGSVLSSAKIYLTLFKDPIVAFNTAESDFRIDHLMNHDEPVSLYIVTRGADKERLKPLIRLFLTMAIRHAMGAELVYENGRALMPHKRRLLGMFDEFPSLGRITIMEDALTKCAGYGIKMFIAVQGREQLVGAYGPNQTITGNCHVRIVYAPNEVDSAKWISEMTGETTIIKEDVTESGGKHSLQLASVSRTYHEVHRTLLTPGEVMQLKKPKTDKTGRIIESGDMLVFSTGEPPIKGTQILYFLDPVFSKRAQIPPPESGRTLP